jgi:DNA-binding transcriptional MerR regulator
MKYTVKQLADVAGVTPRTLHYYDQIGLLRPAVVGENGYRYYNEDAVLRLQQIMFFRELDFSLAEIQAIVDEPEFDLLKALQSHKRLLQERLGRLSDLIQTIDRTLLHLKGAKNVETHDLFVGFDEARQEQYEQEIAQRYGDEQLKESRKRWGSYSPQQKEQIKAEGNAVYLDLVAYIGQDPAGPAVQRIIARWHDHIRYFYEPTRAIMMGLAEGYASHPDFVALYERMHPQLPEFLRQAILYYCQGLPETVQPQLDDTLVTLLGDQ